MAANRDYFKHAETLLKQVFNNWKPSNNSRLPALTGRLLAHLDGREQDQESLVQLKDRLRSALQNIGLNPLHTDHLAREAQKYIDRLNQPELPEPERERKTSPGQPSYIPQYKGPKPSEVSDDLPNKGHLRVYKELMAHGGELAQQCWQLVQDHRASRHRSGLHTLKNWLFKLAMDDAGYSPAELTTMRASLAHFAKTGPRDLTAPPTPVYPPAPYIDQEASGETLFRGLLAQHGMIKIATRYMARRYVDKDGNFSEPSPHSTGHDWKKFEKLLGESGIDTSRVALNLQSFFRNRPKKAAELAYANGKQQRR